MFLSTSADIAFYGGAAGGGKTFALLLENIRHIGNPDFGSVIFRQSLKQVKNEGGLLDESSKLYPYLDASINMTDLYWKFKSGATVSFGYLEQDKDVFNWQGAQIPLICFDELTHFSKRQFFYMLSRNRSTCGVKPYVRATTNPDKKSWVRSFIDWWIYPKHHPLAGFANPDRSGVIRYFVVDNDTVVWADSPTQLPKHMREFAKSFTFISAKLQDNKILMGKDPGYLANLKALSRVERAKLLDGNWDAEESAGELFKKEWFPILSQAPLKFTKVVRYWDRAASESETADWTVGLKLGQMPDGRVVIIDMVRFRGSPAKVETAIKNTATQDNKTVAIGLEQDPGQAGKSEAEALAKKLYGYNVQLFPATKDKITRSLPASAQAELGNILVVEAPWNDDLFQELEAFPDGAHDDIVDTLSGAFNMLTSGRVGTFSKEMAQFDPKEQDLDW